MTDLNDIRLCEHDVVLWTSSSDWGGIYVDGVLVDEGHESDLMERLIETHLGIEFNRSSDVLVGGNRAAKTYKEIQDWVESADFRADMAAQKRADAAALLAEADRLEK